MTEKNIIKPTFSDYLFILYKWRKFLIVNLLILTTLTTIVSFLIPKTYKATATVMIPPDNSALGGLGSLFSGGKSALSLGAAVFGTASTNEDLILGLLYSRGILTKIINKFDLINYYSISDRNIDLAIKAFVGDLNFDTNEFGFIEINVIHENQAISSEIANEFVHLADSLNIKLNIEQAQRNRIFIEKRYFKNLSDLKIAEEKFNKFQKEFGVFDVPEQIKLVIQTVGSLQSELIKNQIILEALKGKLSSKSSQITNVISQINAIKKKIHDLNSSNEKNNKSMLIAFDDIPDLQTKYIRLYRELEIQNKVLEYTYPMYEQAKIEEQKSIPTLLVVDKAIPPIEKYAPKKAFIILFVFFLALFIFIPLVFRAETILHLSETENILVDKEKKFYEKYFLKLYNIILK